MAGICSGPGPCDVTPLGAGKNWVTKVGGLPLYIRAIAHALRRSGHSQSESIQLAVGTVQRWARGGGNVTGPTRARAAAALAEWERKRAEAHLSGSDAVSIDLAYQWKHGWIPLTPAALAVKLHKAHGGASGLKSNDVRKALGTHMDFREGFEKGRAEVKGRSFSPGDLRDSARKHEATSAAHLQHAGDSFYPQATKDATREAGHAAGLRHEAALSQRRFQRGSVEKDTAAARARGFTPKPDIAVLRGQMKAPYSPGYLKGGKPTAADVDALIHNYGVMHGKPPSASAQAKLRKKAGISLSNVDLAFDPSEARTPTGTWTTGGGSTAPAQSSPAQVKQQASAVGVDPAVLAQVAKNLGMSTADLSGMVAQANAAKAAKKSSGGSSGGGGASKGAASVAAAQAKRIAALKAAKAAFTAAEKKQAAQDLATTKLQLASTLATNAKATTASTTKAKAINALPDAQRALLNGSVPPNGYRWGNNGSLVTQAGASLSGGNRMSVDLASQSQLLPDMDSVRKAAAKLSKLPPPLRKAMAARLAARAKQLGATLSLSSTGGRIVDLAVDQAQRDAAKSAGLTFPGTDSFPLAGPDGKFDAGLAKKAVGMVQLSNAASAPAIRTWLMARCKANGAAGIIPANWNADGTTK